MAANEGDEATVSLVDVLEEDEELENEASAVLAGSDPEKCSYPEASNLWTRTQYYRSDNLTTSFSMDCDEITLLLCCLCRYPLVILWLK